MTPGSRELLVVGATVLGGIAGGLLAVLWWQPDLAVGFLVLVVGALVGVASALLMTVPRRQAGRAGLGTYVWAPEEPSLVTPPRGIRPALPPPAELAPRVILPLPPDEPRTETGEWWTRSSPAHVPPAPPRPSVDALPPLGAYSTASAVIAQCPRCGDFRLDVTRAGPEYRFTCRSCAYAWAWTPGTPWPPVAVRRNLRDGTRAEQS